MYTPSFASFAREKVEDCPKPGRSLAVIHFKSYSMTTAIYPQKVYKNRLFLVSLFILSPLFFSCKAQTSPQTLLEPAKGSPVALNCSPGNITAGDVNNDGKPDLVVACAQSRRLTLFKGKGNGQFDVMTGNIPLLPVPPHEIVIGDMNNDGHVDLVIGSHDSYVILILPGDGKGNFTISDSVTMKKGSHPHTHGLGIGDVNGDGYTDIITANSSDNDIAVMLNSRTGGFAPAPGSPFPVGPAPYPLTLGDVNSDRYLDIVSTSTQSSSRKLSLLLGDGRGNFHRSEIPLRTANPWFVAIGDINKDRVPDMVMTHSERSELTVLTGSESGSFTEVTGSPFNLGSSAWHVAITDMNGDANPDVLTAANNGVRVMLGDGRGQFVAAPGSPYLTGKGTWHLAISDVNGDGKPDVVTSNLESNNVSILLGR